MLTLLPLYRGGIERLRTAQASVSQAEPMLPCGLGLVVPSALALLALEGPGRSVDFPEQRPLPDTGQS